MASTALRWGVVFFGVVCYSECVCVCVCECDVHHVERMRRRKMLLWLVVLLQTAAHLRGCLSIGWERWWGLFVTESPNVVVFLFRSSLRPRPTPTNSLTRMY